MIIDSTGEFVPEGWDNKLLKQCLENLKSGKYVERGWSPQCLSHPAENTWGVLKTTAVQMGEYLPEYNKELPETLEPKVGLEVNDGDFLVTTTGPRNRCGVICHVKTTPKKLIFSGKILRFRADENQVLPAFLMYLLMSPSYQKVLDKLKVGTSDSSVSIGNQQILDLEIPLASIEEQGKIVEILEEQLSHLDAALASVRSVREKAVRFRRSLLHAAFTGALTGHDSSLGTLPNEWKLLKIADFASVKGGKRLPKGAQWSDVETNHPYIRATDIKNGKINEENLVYVPEKTWPAISRYIVATNDVIITIAGTIGSVAVVPETLNDANLTENAAKICHLQNVLPRFLLLYLMSPETQTVISGLSTSTTQAKLALFRIESIEVPTPSLSEQKKIVEIVDTQISILDQSLSLVDAVERKASALRRSLLHSAFTGELTKEWREGAHV